MTKARWLGAVAAVVYLHAALLFGQFDYAFDAETASLVFVVTPIVGVIGALIVCGWGE